MGGNGDGRWFEYGFNRDWRWLGGGGVGELGMVGGVRGN